MVKAYTHNLQVVAEGGFVHESFIFSFVKKMCFVEDVLAKARCSFHLKIQVLFKLHLIPPYMEHPVLQKLLLSDSLCGEFNFVQKRSAIIV